MKEIMADYYVYSIMFILYTQIDAITCVTTPLCLLSGCRDRLFHTVEHASRLIRALHRVQSETFVVLIQKERFFQSCL